MWSNACAVIDSNLLKLYHPHMSLSLKKAKHSDLEWVNARYDEVHFVHSNLEKEAVIIAEWDGQQAGLGRLVQVDESSAEMGGIYVLPEFRKQGIASAIVQALVEEGSPFAIIYCLPFGELKEYYGRFGFRDLTEEEWGEVPQKLREKYDWAQENYEKEVLLLCRA